MADWQGLSGARVAGTERIEPHPDLIVQYMRDCRIRMQGVISMLGQVTPRLKGGIEPSGSSLQHSCRCRNSHDHTAPASLRKSAVFF